MKKFYGRPVHSFPSLMMTRVLTFSFQVTVEEVVSGRATIGDIHGFSLVPLGKFLETNFFGRLRRSRKSSSTCSSSSGSHCWPTHYVRKKEINHIMSNLMANQTGIEIFF